MLNFRDPELLDDPYPTFARLRSEDAVHQLAPGTWVLTRHKDVSSVSRDPRFGHDTRKLNNPGARVFLSACPVLREFHETAMPYLDQPDHGRLRKLSSHAFLPNAISRLEPIIARIANELVATLPEHGDVDLIRAFALPFPVRVIAALIGLPSSDCDRLAAWSEALISTIDVGITFADARRAEVAAREFLSYIGAVVAERKQQPSDGLLDHLVGSADTTSDAEVCHNLMALLIAGSETTTHLLGNGILALLRHPAELAKLRADPSLLPSAVEELLRYTSPVLFSSRCALEDVVVDDKRIGAGDQVLLVLGAANHDPAVFDEPEVVRLDRQPNPHVAFGSGPYYCIAAPLARVEARIAFRALLERYPRISVDESRVRVTRRLNPRGLTELGLRVSTDPA